MGSYRLSRHIVASSDEVYRAFTDPILMADWLHGTGVIEMSGPLDQTGSTYTLVIRGPWRFRSSVVHASPPRLHETAGRGPLGSAFRMVATLGERDGGTDLELLTEYTVPFGSLGRWMDRRWLESGPRTAANREVDRLVELVSGPTRGPALERSTAAAALDR